MEVYKKGDMLRLRRNTTNKESTRTPSGERAVELEVLHTSIERERTIRKVGTPHTVGWSTALG
eukprot:14778030-Heterocapsa_arctica.AAC.1